MDEIVADLRKRMIERGDDFKLFVPCCHVRCLLDERDSLLSQITLMQGDLDAAQRAVEVQPADSKKVLPPKKSAK